MEQWVGHWVRSQSLSANDVDCATTVMLKILDGKCKMKTLEKKVMAALYDQVKQEAGELIGPDMHELIADVRGLLSEADKDRVYEKRVLAETMISRPVMKGFKARIRQNGLFLLPAELLQQLEEEEAE
ncbi:MAG: hypothetical protein D9N11_00715 [Ketobacter sp.]|nr:MAG: hypothetical protein D9N11_00715 [Ketobacter sp.]